MFSIQKLSQQLREVIELKFPLNFIPNFPIDSSHYFLHL